MTQVRYILLVAALLMAQAGAVYAAGVAVNEDGALPDASAMLDVKNTAKGFLPPRMTAAQRAAISAPATGLVVYQTDGTAGLYSYNGSAWVQVGAGSVTSVSGTAPVSVANGTTTPAISMAKSTGSVDGYLAATDFATFAAKGGGSVTSVSGTAPISVANGTTTPAITLGTVGVANGGTGTTTGSITGTSALTFTAGGSNQNVTVTPSGTGYTLLNGNVGIGTQWPSSKLSVLGDGASGGANFMSYWSSGGTIIKLGRFRGTSGALSGLLSGDLIGSISADSGLNDMFSFTNTSINFYSEENYSDGVAGSRITFATTNNGTNSLTEKMRITNAGKVGIGTILPNHELEVNGTFAARVAINAQTASYTLAAIDNNKFITMDSTGAMTLTLPLNASVGIPVGFQCTIAQKNTGTVTISSSATMITTATTRAFKAKGSAVTIIKTGTDEWMLFGDMN
jgi:hypothetical protein